MKYNSTAKVLYEEDLCLQEVRESSPMMNGEWLDNRKGDMILGNADWVVSAKATGDDPIVWKKTREVRGSHKVTCVFRKFGSDKLNFTLTSENETGAYQKTFWITDESHLNNVRQFVTNEGFVHMDDILATMRF